MNKSVLMSYSPYWYYLIGEGIKKIEVRKKVPQDPNWNRQIECYMTKDKKSFARIPKEFQEKYHAHMGKVGMRFRCVDITQYQSEFWDDETYEAIHEKYEPLDFEEYGEYEYDLIATNDDNRDDNPLCKGACLSWEELRKYIGIDIKEFCVLHISNLKIYDNPKELGEFKKPCPQLDCACGITKQCNQHLTRPPQSWCYVEEL